MPPPRAPRPSPAGCFAQAPSPATRRRFCGRSRKGCRAILAVKSHASARPDGASSYSVDSVRPKPPIRLGANVRHPKFGTGFVTDVEGNGAHARVQVNFEDVGSKWLVLAYANLSPA